MKTRFDRDVFLAAFDRLRGLVSDTCERFEVAGSVRRGRQFANDLECLAIPKLGSARVPDGMFETVVAGVDLLDLRLSALLEDGVIVRPPKIQMESGERNPPWGPSWKQFLLAGVPVDFFTACPNTWGRQMVTRTGPGDFSKALVTPRPGGFKPMGLVCRDGGVYTAGGTLIPTPEEADYFHVLGVAWLEPSERDDWKRILGREGKRLARVHPAVEDWHLR